MEKLTLVKQNVWSLIKKSVTVSSLVLSAIMMTAQSAKADDISLGIPGYGGNGCPAGSASVTLSPDQKSLTLIFDQFLVEANRQRRVDRKSCNIAIPVHVPQGLSVSIIEADYRGYVSLPVGAQARFSAEYFFAGLRGPRVDQVFNGYHDKDYLVNNRIGVQALVWSPCGEDVNLRVNSSMTVRTTTGDALATVDTADFKAGIVYQIQWRRCGGF